MAKKPIRHQDFTVTPELVELVDLVQVTPGYTLRVSLDRLTSAPNTYGLGYAVSFSEQSGFKSKSFMDASSALAWFKARIAPQVPAAA